MKFSLTLLAANAYASHYRGGTFKYAQASGNRLRITQTQTWRKGRDLYNGGCNQNDVTNQVPSDKHRTTTCSGASGCTSLNMKYTALFTSTKYNYCYGDGSGTIKKPSRGFNFGWTACCWVNLNDDSGRVFNGGSMNIFMRVRDLSNTSPEFKLPPLWIIMAGCPNQQIDLDPKDSDSVTCRWATSGEAGSGIAWSTSRYPSLSLDTQNCIVKYDGTLDRTTTGSKAIGITMIDRDGSGNIRSEIPVQFIAHVWTPNIQRSRALGYAQWPDWFAGPEHPDHVDTNRKRRSGEKWTIPTRSRRSLPAHCTAVPTFSGNTPANGAILDATSGAITLLMQAVATLTGSTIKEFSYQAPPGLQCGAIQHTSTYSRQTCSWTLTPAQQKIRNHSFCFDALDSNGLISARRCITIQGKGIDYCGTGANSCKTNTKCVNHNGAYKCECNAGYKQGSWSTSSKNCVDIDECAGSNKCGAHTVCQNSAGSYSCQCQAGYAKDTWTSTLQTCKNNNECQTGANSCKANTLCVDTTGGYECKCKPGYTKGTWTSSSKSCVNVNECVSSTSNVCGYNTNCVDTVGAYNCQCKTGFKPSAWRSSIKACSDVKECQDNSLNVCGANTVCVEKAGTYDCECEAGYEKDVWSSTSKTCKNINECATGAHSCGANAQCADNNGGYACNCDAGYQRGTWTAAKKDCVDIDECLGNNKCGAFSTCSNKVGTYECICNRGYEKDVWTTTSNTCKNINECSNANLNVCGANTNCADTHGGYTCSCKNGYTQGTWTNAKQECNDIDECANNTHKCGSNTLCRNTAGTHECDCVTGFQRGSFRSNLITCTDVAECANPTLNVCGSNTQCVEKLGGYDCVCDPGYERDSWTATSKTCKNIDECAVGSDTCGANTDCTDTNGSYTCSCKAGYKKGTWTSTVKLCVDDDECAGNSHICGVNTHCINSVGSYACQCQTGYEKDIWTSSAQNCKNSNECSNGNNVCGNQTTCTDTIGSYTCSCNTGYEQGTWNSSDKSCVDSDECTNGNHVCSHNTKCVNTVGSHRCDCLPGFQRGTWRSNLQSCTDIQECMTPSLNVCGLNTVCVNKAGSYDCECQTGYEKDQWGSTLKQCKDIDECSVGASAYPICGANTHCVNTVGSYTCACDVGYTQDTWTAAAKTCIVCTFKDIEMTCNENRMAMKVPVCLYERHGLVPSEMILGKPWQYVKPECVGVRVGKMMHYAVRRDECDVITKFNSTASSYTATAREISSDLITRAGSVKSIDFQCKYNDIVTVTADEHFKPITSYTEIYSQTEQTTFKVRMSLFSDKNMTAALLDGQPIAIPDPVYSKLQVLGVRSSAMAVQIETCWATPTSDANHMYSYTLIDNFAGAPAELNSNNLGITQNCKNDVASWWMNSFGFPRHDSVYMHCTVRICNPDHNTCTCGANTVRRRRDVSEPDVGTIDVELKVTKPLFIRG